jgi:hypothetical protein
MVDVINLAWNSSTRSNQENQIHACLDLQWDETSNETLSGKRFSEMAWPVFDLGSSCAMVTLDS